MSERENESWRLFECIEKHEDCLKIKCNLFDKEFIVSRNGCEKADCSTRFVFSRLLHWIEECREYDSGCSLVSASQSSWNINHSQALKLHYAIGELIAVDNEPLSVVEKRGFKRLLSRTTPQYKIPSRKYFSSKILPDMYNRVKEVMKVMLSRVQWMSLTSDIWSCSGTNYSFISLTAHWLDDHFERRSAALNIDVFPGSHTGDAIADKITNILSSWGIEKIKIHTLMRDNGGNMAKGCRVSDICSESCTIHTLQLVIKNAVESDQAVTTLLKKCKKIAKYFHKSSPASTKLVEIQEDLNIIVKKLKQDVPTRWNSTFYLLLRFLELEICLDLFAEAENDDSKSLTCTEWKLLEELVKLLQPFEEVTKSLSYNESSISEVIPTIRTLMLCLSKQEVSLPLISFKKALESNLKIRFENLESNINFTMATFLDPRYKTVFFTSNCLDEIKECIEITLIEGDNVQNESTNFIPIKKSSGNLWDSFDEIVASSFKESSAKKTLEEEIDLYLKQALVKRSPSKWWDKMKGNFPHLSQLVHLYLSTPSSSIYSERLFSESGNISDKRRKNLLPKNLELLTFLHHNLPLINYEY